MSEDTLESLMRIAIQQHCAEIVYQKPYDAQTTTRIIEPYELQQNAGNLMVKAWQVDPEISDHDSWRNFRLDRIASIADSGQTFKPRRRQSMLDGEVSEWKPDRYVPTEPIEIYEHFLTKSLADKRITKNELIKIKVGQEGLTPGEIRAVHARVYASEIEDLAMDDDIDEAEMKYAKDLRGFLEHLGWSP